MLEKRSDTKYQLRYLLGVARALVGNVNFFVNSTKTATKSEVSKIKSWCNGLLPLPQDFCCVEYYGDSYFVNLRNINLGLIYKT